MNTSIVLSCTERVQSAPMYIEDQRLAFSNEKKAVFISASGVLCIKDVDKAIWEAGSAILGLMMFLFRVLELPSLCPQGMS